MPTGRWYALRITSAQFRTLAWYAKRPQFLPELVRRTVQSRSGGAENNYDEVMAICERTAISVQDALELFSPEYKISREHDLLRSYEEEALWRVQEIDESMGGGADLDLLFGIATILKPRRVLETGVAWGWSTLALLLATSHLEGATVVSVDMPYVKKKQSGLVGAAVPKELRVRWTLLRLADRQGIPKALRRLGDLDLAHYDSDKTRSGRWFAYPLIWKHLVAGGVLVSDDVADNDAFINFAKQVGVPPVIVRLENKFAGILLKPNSGWHGSDAGLGDTLT